MKQILVLNLGSTSFKFKLYDMDGGENLLATGSVQSIGTEGTLEVRTGLQSRRMPCACQTHADALIDCLDALGEIGFEVSMDALTAIGYKAVHGGSVSGTQLVTEELLQEMERMAPFAPAHNPVYIRMMRSMREKYPQCIQIASFETSFHATVPLRRAVYGVPDAWRQQYGIRRYGFHGSSHSYIAWKMRQLAPGAKRIISVHLGGSNSLCAILDGKSIANSMGATPQSGVFHNNRVGDFDVFCLPLLAEKLGGIDNTMNALSAEGGLLGISGVSNDLRAVLGEAEQGNARAQLAVDAFVDIIIGYIGMYTAYLGGLDVLVFTGGIGQNSAYIRSKVASAFDYLGLSLSEIKNHQPGAEAIHAENSAVQVWALETNEELMVARNCCALLDA